MVHRFLTERFVYMPADGSVDRPILGAVLGDERTLYIDAGNSKRHAAAFRESVRREGLVRQPLTALTHWHWDHSFGAAEDTETLLIAHERTRNALTTQVGLDWSDAAIDERVRAGTEIEFCATYMKKEFGSDRDIDVRLPDVTFDRSLTLHLGGATCRIDHVGGVHADDSCFLYVPEERVLFLGDALGPAIYDGPRYYKAGDLLRLLERVRAYDAEWYIESHHRPVQSDEFWAEMKEFGALAEIVLAYGDNEAKVSRELEAALGRPLTDDDRRTVGEFMEGERR